MEMYPDVDAYLAASEQWPDEITALRPLLVGWGLTEEVKWGKPCYTHGGKNIVLLQEMKDFLSVMFFKGALIADPDSVLVEQGPNSRSARRIEVTSVEQIERMREVIELRVTEAIAIEEAGLEVEAPGELVLAEELQSRLDADPALREAFAALTPGRQREYNLHISGAKKTETRAARVDKHADRILSGKGLRDR